jgi:molybdate transport system regulatory protein
MASPSSRKPRRARAAAGAERLALPRLWLRVDLAAEEQVGPGKIRLLELIAEHGSISAAGRAMGMSYRRAWLLVESLNATFRDPAVTTQHGGARGGGAELTEFGRELIRRFRAMELAASAAVAEHLLALDRSRRS